MSYGKARSTQKIGNTVVKTRFNRNRSTYLTDKGDYAYVHEDGSRIAIPQTKGTADIFIVSNQLDKEQDASDERYEKLTDHIKSYDEIEIAADGEDDTQTDGCISTSYLKAAIAPNQDVHELAFPETETQISEEERTRQIVREVIKSLPERWQNYFFDLYGGVVANQEEYRHNEMEETGETKSPQAICKMDTKIKKAVCEALGVPMPPKKRGRKG